MRVKDVDVVSVPVSDPERARRFYVDTLGFELMRDDESVPDMRWIQVRPAAGATSLTLVTWFDTMPAGSLRGLVLVCDDLQAEYERLSAAGVRFAQPPQQQPWALEAVFSDPDGNLLVLQHREPTQRERSKMHSAEVSPDADRQVHCIYIKASREVVWQALTSRETTAKYGYGAPVDIELSPGGSFRQLASDEMKVHGGPDVIADGEVVEVQAPERLVHTTRFLWDPETAAEGHTTVSYELETTASGATKLIVLHRLEGAPRTAALVAGAETGGGWPEILSDLKTLLETGKPLAG
jgi:uncharacterized protein YndB with AHSA1/START domain/predicted enzyme related to lactoylglutathione lyase